MSIASICFSRPAWAAILAALLLQLGAARAQTATPGALPPDFPDTPRTVGAVSGAVQRIGDFVSLNADCSSTGFPAVHVWRRPTAGVVRVVHGVVYTHNTPATGLAQCNAHPVPATILQYLAPADFTGTDALAFSVTWPDGGLRLISLKVVVAPDDAKSPDGQPPDAPAGLRHIDLQ